MMRTLPSGLPEAVANEEELSRFLTQSGQFNSIGAKAAGFLPNPKYKNTSVFRIGNVPDLLRRIWDETNTSGRSLKCIAICSATVVRGSGLDVLAEEPPPFHANVERWPWNEGDLELQKAQQLEIAGMIAANSAIIRI